MENKAFAAHSHDGTVKIGEEAVRLLPVEQGNYYYFTLEGLTAVRMNDRIRSVLHGTKDGQPYYSPVDDYSVADYAYTQLSRDGNKESLKILCANLLRYGSAAQLYKEYRTDYLPDSAMTEAYRAYLSDLSAVSFGNNNVVLGDMEDPIIQWVGKSLELNSKVALKFVFNLGTYSGNVEDLELEVSYTDRNGENQVIRVSNAESYGNAANRYAFTFDGLLASELRTVVSVRVCIGETYLSQTLQYSADTYGNNKTGTLGDLCKALFAYSDSARSYFLGNNA